MQQKNTITVLVNGENHVFNDPITVAMLTQQLGLDTRKIAVERNLAIVPKSLYDVTGLAEGDRLEIVNFVGGG